MQLNKQQQYLKVRVETASPAQLTLLLYQETVKSLLLAKQFYSLHQYEDMNNSLQKVRSIFSELISTLDMKYEISHNLSSLYFFYSRHLADFMIKRDEKILDEVIEFARGMLETWKQAMEIQKKGSDHIHA